MKELRLFSEYTEGWFVKNIGEPTEIQKKAWPAIASGQHTLVSAPTGTGKTLSAFLVFLDRMLTEAVEGTLAPGLQLIYISPLKSLAADIRENLKRPLEGIAAWSGLSGAAAAQTGKGGRDVGKPEEGRIPVRVAVRTGDTSQSDRRKMLKNPPHILITTPESLYLLLTGKAGREMLKSARAVILDELHAVIDTKRGAHLMLSLARLDAMREKPLQRIGLSATIEPLEAAAAYLAPEPVVIAAPKMKKEISIRIVNCLADWQNGRKHTVWERMAENIYQRCKDAGSVIAFVEGRRAAEKLAFQVNLLGGDGFAKTHHGSMSKEQRQEVEEELRQGKLRLLCATSSMELGIDVGEIEQVLQVGCPKSVSAALQRLGRAGHHPGRTSVMTMFPKTAAEGLYCGLTAEAAKRNGVEKVHPPRLCFDVLAQHLVSMASGEGCYSLDEVMEILKRAQPFLQVTREDVRSILEMLAGDYEHAREIPVRPRILYDRLNERVSGDSYSRMLAASAGGTIPDRGLFAVRTQGGVKLGEVDEEFVYEARIGDKFLLGAFAWKIINQDKDNVYVEPASTAGATPPFWKGDFSGRGLETGRAFGRILRRLTEDCEKGRLDEALAAMGMDAEAADAVGGLIKRQIEAAGILPDDRTILVEHFRDSNGMNQMMVHSVFGRRVNAPLSLLLELAAREQMGEHVSSVEEENGILLYPYGKGEFPKGLLHSIAPETAAGKLELLLPETSMFGMTFRYNAARALMMGAGHRGRQPLWLQRMRSAGMLENLIAYQEHPLIREAKRECMEDQWDINGVETVLKEIRSGEIQIREIYTKTPSPMSLPLQWAVEAAEMYDYVPVPAGVAAEMTRALSQSQMIEPEAEFLKRTSERKSLPKNPRELHSLLMTEGDLTAGELDVPIEWLEELAEENRVLYREPGLWIAAEQEEEYGKAFDFLPPENGREQQEEGQQERLHIVRRALRYRGAMTAGQIAERYFLSGEQAGRTLEALCAREAVIKRGDYYYHRDLYDRARRETLKSRRLEIKTMPGERYADFLQKRRISRGGSGEGLKQSIRMLCGEAFSPGLWESVILPDRVSNYSPASLDALLAEGELFWQMIPGEGIAFYPYEAIDWEAEPPSAEELQDRMFSGERLSEKELLIYEALRIRGASFMQALNHVLSGESAHETLLSLMEKGLVRADSFVPVRQWLEKDRTKKASPRQRVNVRVKALNAGRWEIIRPFGKLSAKELLEQTFDRMGILSRETLQRRFAGSGQEITWTDALQLLRVWEYTGEVRRGYFVEGMSGAQFIREKEFGGIIRDLQELSGECVWLTAADPAQIYGKILPHDAERAFLNVPGTAVALYNGTPIAVFERLGKILRVFSEDKCGEALEAFVREYKGGRIFSQRKRIVVKEYPAEAAKALQQAGFQKEMLDYALYR